MIEDDGDDKLMRGKREEERKKGRTPLSRVIDIV